MYVGQLKVNHVHLKKHVVQGSYDIDRLGQVCL
jgi:hypothetical protein